MSDERERVEQFLADEQCFSGGTPYTKSWNEIFQRLEMPEPTRQLLIHELSCLLREERARGLEEAANYWNAQRALYQDIMLRGLPSQYSAAFFRQDMAEKFVTHCMQQAKALREKGGQT